jgi:hypothetical protein
MCRDIALTRSSSLLSMDDNMFHISFESGILEDPAATPPESTHKYTKPLSECKSTPDDIQIFFEKGDPVKVVVPGWKLLHTLIYKGFSCSQRWICLHEISLVSLLVRLDCIRWCAQVLNVGTKEEASTPATILKLLNRLGGVHSIGRIDIVENRFVSAQHKFGIPIAFLILGRRCLCFFAKEGRGDLSRNREPCP